MKKYGETDKYYDEVLPVEAIKVIKGGNIKKFDKLIIDEGQDLLRDRYVDVMDRLLDGGFGKGNWNIFCDFKRQNIFADGIGEEQMMDMIKSRADFAQFSLTVNCRSTKPIAEEISDLFKYDGRKTIPDNLEGIDVSYKLFGDNISEKDLLMEVLKELKRERIEARDITILSSHRADKSIIHDLIEDDGGGELARNGLKIVNFNEDHQLFLDRGDAVTFGTIYKFKGMENSYIIIIDISKDIDRTNFENLLYVGMTRARFGLILLVDEKMQDRLKALKA